MIVRKLRFVRVKPPEVCDRSGVSGRVIQMVAISWGNSREKQWILVENDRRINRAYELFEIRFN
jgi:hypothetical protein